MRRRSDWRRRLSTAIEQRKKTPFFYGHHDCSLAAANLILAMTDIDLMQHLRGQYSTAAGAYRVVRKQGHKSLPDMVASLANQHDMHAQSIECAMIGDLVVANGVEADLMGPFACGIWLGSAGIFAGDPGWSILPQNFIIQSYRISL